MSSKTDMISYLNKLYRDDPWVNELFNSAGVEMDKIGDLLDEIVNQMFFDTAIEDGLMIYEKELGITTNTSLNLADRRSAISAKWKMGSKSDLELIQLIADSWHNGAVEVEFLSGKIHVQFVSIYGIPTDLDGLKDAIEQIKPAHLAIYYTFKYRTHGQLTSYTHVHLASYTHAEIRGEVQDLG
jgi:hypothetical protein